MFSRIRYRISLKYVVLTAVVMAVVFGALFFWISARHTRLIIQQVEKQALILYRQIVFTRQWVSDHGYVLVAEKPLAADLSQNQAPSVDIDIIDGCPYSRITPAGLTRRLSRLAAGSRMYEFNITSLGHPKGHCPPDAFERQALEQFHNGRLEPFKRMEIKDGRHVFRYAAPLEMRRSCLACHEKETFGYGGVGGCISVLIPFEKAYRAIRRERLILLVTMSAMAAGIVAVLFLFARRMIFTPIDRIRDLTSRMRAEAFGGKGGIQGDELKEFAGLCCLMDEKLNSYHQVLEKKIAEATRDLSRTNGELEKANEELRALNAARIEFFSEISHELRTPLTSIKGAADILARKGSCSEPVYVNIIKKNTDYLIRTIVDFLDYSRIEAGRLELEAEDTDLAELAAEVIAARRPETVEKDLEISLEHRGPAMVKADRYRIYQVFSNLLANAIRFSPEGGKVRVTVTGGGEHVTVSLTDQGPGIAPRYHRAVFDKFFQVPGRQAPDGAFKGSSGIGLAICRALVTAHGGRIWVDSRPGAGSRFVFVLPREPKRRKGETDAKTP